MPVRSVEIRSLALADWFFITQAYLYVQYIPYLYASDTRKE